ncbi:MAG: hypothetical protein RLN76_02750 [Phycisphaeraceae bacterium]
MMFLHLRFALTAIALGNLFSSSANGEVVWYELNAQTGYGSTISGTFSIDLSQPALTVVGTIDPSAQFMFDHVNLRIHDTPLFTPGLEDSLSGDAYELYLWQSTSGVQAISWKFGPDPEDLSGDWHWVLGGIGFEPFSGDIHQASRITGSFFNSNLSSIYHDFGVTSDVVVSLSLREIPTPSSLVCASLAIACLGLRRFR